MLLKFNAAHTEGSDPTTHGSTYVSSTQEEGDAHNLTYSAFSFHIQFVPSNSRSNKVVTLPAVDKNSVNSSPVENEAKEDDFALHIASTSDAPYM